MAIYTDSGNDDVRQVATNIGWGGFGTWIETQDAPLARALWETGKCADTAKLRAELAALTPPEDENAAGILDQLIYNLDATEGAKSIAITNGITND
jgi:hypothetical protein